jgi:DinB superfamily
VHTTAPHGWEGEAGPGRWGRLGNVSVERCAECGFDAGDWSDAGAIVAIERLPSQWTAALAGLTRGDQLRRPVRQMWSIAEYADHVREVLFGMRFLLDTAIAQPGTDLGESPPQRFASRPRQIDAEAALTGIDQEARALSQQLSELSPVEWSLTVAFDGISVNPRWIARHIVHDATHHLLDVDRLRSAL